MNVNNEIRNIRSLFLFTLCIFLNASSLEAQVPDPNLGLRADWLRGSYGLNWKPAKSANGRSELKTLTIKPFLEQIKGLKSVDYIQLHLGESFIFSPVHLAPHDLLESFWEGDTDENGNPINLVVPRAAIERDPFLDLILDVKKAGLKVQVYVNSTNMLSFWRGNTDPWQVDAPEELPDVTERWKNWCDTNPEAQAFIKSQSYHSDPDWPTRKYMFCYAEFILKDYAIRYGDLIDAWIFDNSKTMRLQNGEKLTGKLEDQRIYQAWAEACHAGNPDAAISFNNGQGSDNGIDNPWAAATLFDDYMFGHPFKAGRYFGKYPINKFSITWLADRDGFIHRNDPKGKHSWDDNVVGHLDPAMSTMAWNAGDVPALTNEQFVDWYGTALLGGGAMTPGVPLIDRDGWESLIMEDWALEQLTLLDAYLIKNKNTDQPSWARQATVLPNASTGKEYYHKLTEDVDFWASEGNEITKLYIVSNDKSPSWLSIKESKTESGTWILSGLVTDATASDYDFSIVAEDALGKNSRQVSLKSALMP